MPSVREQPGSPKRLGMFFIQWLTVTFRFGYAYLRTGSVVPQVCRFVTFSQATAAL